MIGVVWTLSEWVNTCNIHANWMVSGSEIRYLQVLTSFEQSQNGTSIYSRMVKSGVLGYLRRGLLYREVLEERPSGKYCFWGLQNGSRTPKMGHFGVFRGV